MKMESPLNELRPQLYEDVAHLKGLIFVGCIG
nr:MAG TPA: hypothetical protein [Inoviridae sp.]